MIFRDNITLVAPVDGVYRQTGGERHDVKCVIEQMLERIWTDGTVGCRQLAIQLKATLPR